MSGDKSTGTPPPRPPLPLLLLVLRHGLDSARRKQGRYISHNLPLCT
jgi:hypothetical protein